MMPLSYAELKMSSHQDLESLYRYGGFPEPFHLQSDVESRRWTREYRVRKVRLLA